ncbi:MAG: LptF/LptG family permease [Candidatus Aureabacteria bacterium]|nr:LptF/LptG family permease [Candidatus Auribacterota bacterium]
MKIIHKYIIKETIYPLFLSVFVVTFVLLLVRILRVADMVINKGVSASVVFNILWNMSLYLSQFTIPVAFIVAVLLALGRLSSENEILALRALGVSLYRIALPILIFSFLLSLMLLYMQDKVFPKIKNRTENIFYKISRESKKFALEEKEFIEGLGEYVFYIREIQDDKIKDIIVYEPVGNNTARVITAKQGTYEMIEEANSIFFNLKDGIFDEPKSPESKDFYKIKFDDYKVEIPLRDLSKGQLSKSLSEMSFKELLKKAEIIKKSKTDIDVRPIYNEYYKRITFSFSAFVLTLLAVPLSISIHRSERSVNFAMALGLVVLYYVLLAAGEAATLKGVLIPIVMTSLPNIVLGSIGVYLFVKLVRS